MMVQPEKDLHSRQAVVIKTNCCDRENGTLNPLLLTSLSGFISVSALPGNYRNLLRAGILRISE